MKKSGYFLKSLINSAGVFVYVSAVVWLLSNAEWIFGKASKYDYLVPVFMLLLFVVSATITGLLVLGRPILLFLNKQKREAFIMLFSTLAWLVFFLIAVGIVLVIR